MGLQSTRFSAIDLGIYRVEFNTTGSRYIHFVGDLLNQPIVQMEYGSNFREIALSVIQSLCELP